MHSLTYAPKSLTHRIHSVVMVREPRESRGLTSAAHALSHAPQNRRARANSRASSSSFSAPSDFRAHTTTRSSYHPSPRVWWLSDRIPLPRLVPPSHSGVDSLHHALNHLFSRDLRGIARAITPTVFVQAHTRHAKVWAPFAVAALTTCTVTQVINY